MRSDGERGGAIAWRPLVVCPQIEIAGQLRSALRELGIADARHVAEYPPAGTIVALAARHGCNICFLDVASDEELALRLVSEAAAAMPVVALNLRDDADLILRCLRRGACEFLSHPVAEPVRTLFERLVRGRAKSAGQRRLRVVLRSSGKARLRGQHGGGPLSHSDGVERGGAHTAGGRRRFDRQRRIHAEVEVRVQLGRRRARLGNAWMRTCGGG